MSVCLGGDRATISYNTVINKSGNSHNVSYYDRIDDNSSYRVGAGVSSNGKPSADAYFMHYADAALVTASASHINGEYTSATLSLQGGATLRRKVEHYTALVVQVVLAYLLIQTVSLIFP